MCYAHIQNNTQVNFLNLNINNNNNKVVQINKVINIQSYLQVNKCAFFRLMVKQSKHRFGTLQVKNVTEPLHQRKYFMNSF